ncbi:MAG TPA: thioredoxin domain-containing protein [candidate division WOR-3 bacterium]|uniref:Thioredoxin domain-containing protein n=1 Tax=candidate division WOR-3 bacterium TaxID=2052148 RepID=A0A7V0T6J2_UNCW3|nr:thioredoxin domain-containing protein [candidate division WOR-3 bacterium]
MLNSKSARNRLASESSLYLLEHAENPVDWYPWGPEAWERAHTESRPIFLSIGYSACHWCHVMARESFADEETAAILNEQFVCIKVDREERPDVDETYMEAMRILTGSGGWPLSVFLTPDLKPFYGGTYFPPEPRHGLPGFKRVLLSAAHYFRTEREAVDRAAAAIVEKLDGLSRLERAEGELAPDVLNAYYRQRLEAFDSEQGGFGVAPRFPNPTDLELLLRLSARPGFDSCREMVELTLLRMSEGGIYDQVGGGFHRYSTDTAWLVPHFEKMLYDNALLARLYTEAFAATGNEAWRAVARETLDYLEREMRAPAGGYCASQDADSGGIEGAHHTWSREEFEAALGPELTPLAVDLYGVTKEGVFEGRNVLRIAQPVELLLRAHKLSPDDFWPKLADIRARLLAARNRRAPLRRDEKVLADWNGLALSALARGHQLLGDEALLGRARSLATFIRSRLVRGRDLNHLERPGREPVPGLLADYALVARGFLDLYASDFDPGHLFLARDLTDRMLTLFRTPDGALATQDPAAPGLVSATVSGYDSPVPSGNAVAAHNLLDLARLTGRTDLREAALEILRRFYPVMRRWPTAFATMLSALDRSPAAGSEVVLFLPDPAEERGFVETLRRHPDPDRTVVLVRGAEADPALAELSPLVRDRRAFGGRPTAFYCANNSCREPVHTAAALETLLSPGPLDSPDRRHTL